MSRVDEVILLIVPLVRGIMPCGSKAVQARFEEHLHILLLIGVGVGIRVMGTFEVVRRGPVIIVRLGLSIARQLSRGGD